MIENERPVTPEALVGEVKALFSGGYRMVTATCLDLGEDLEIIYHFDKNYQMVNLRMVFPKDTDIPSITDIYIGAFLIENEINEMFGAKIKGIAVDYGGRLLVTEETVQTPMLKSVTVGSVAVSPLEAAANANGGA